MKASELIRVLQFADSALPIGGFTFSNGVEAAIQKGVVHDKESLKSFVRTSLEVAAHTDGIALTAAHRAVIQAFPTERLSMNQCEFESDQVKALMAQLIRIDRAVLNRKLNEEARLMTTRMGKKLAEISVHTFEHPLVAAWLAEIKAGHTPGTQPITQALVMAVQHIPEREVMVMHQYGIAMTILSAAMRLMRVTHYETQHILFELNEEIDQFCDVASSGDITEMVSYVPVIDLLAAIHTQSFVRLFMN